MPTNLTIAQLFGTDSIVGTRPGQDYPADKQEFSFPGVNGTYITGLGLRGQEIIWNGTMRSSIESSPSMAAAALEALIVVVQGYRTGLTILNFMYGDSSPMANLYASGSTYNNIVLLGFRETSPRLFSADAGGFRCVVQIEARFVKVA